MKNFTLRFLIITIAFLFCFAGNNVFAKGTKNPSIIENPQIFSGYMQRLQAKIKSNWNPPKAENSTHVVALFKVIKNGKISSIKIIEPSDNPAMNKAAIEALKKSSPLEALPSEYVGNSVDIQFRFDYNVYKKNED